MLVKMNASFVIDFILEQLVTPINALLASTLPTPLLHLTKQTIVTIFTLALRGLLPGISEREVLEHKAIFKISWFVS